MGYERPSVVEFCLSIWDCFAILNILIFFRDADPIVEWQL